MHLMIERTGRKAIVTLIEAGKESNGEDEDGQELKCGWYKCEVINLPYLVICKAMASPNVFTSLPDVDLLLPPQTNALEFN